MIYVRDHLMIMKKSIQGSLATFTPNTIVVLCMRSHTAETCGYCRYGQYQAYFRCNSDHRQSP
jgi:hypothetical protein